MEEFAVLLPVIVAVAEVTSVDMIVCVPAVSVTVPVALLVAAPELCAELEELPFVTSLWYTIP